MIIEAHQETEMMELTNDSIDGVSGGGLLLGLGLLALICKPLIVVKPVKPVCPPPPTNPCKPC